MLDPDSTELDAALDGIPDDPEPAPSGDPAEGGASASSPSPAAPAPHEEIGVDEVLDEFRGPEYTPENLFIFIQGAVQAYHEKVPDSHPLITDLHNSAKRLIQAIIVEKVVPNVTHPNDEILVKLLSNDHPTADLATINTHLTVAYQEVCG